MSEYTGSAAGAHLTIGEVLSLLQEDFPEISISKIRFLESQGLIEPERTPSGYRKFYPHDIERLRWILRQQRDNFLPLRVIRDKLDGGDEDGRSEVDEGAAADDSTDGVDGSPAASTDRVNPLDAGPSTVSLTREELASAAGTDVAAVVELESFGLLNPKKIGPAQYYDGEALAVAKIAVAMRTYGVDARHLRMYRTAADREAGVYEQVILPIVKQRNPAARRRAQDTLVDLAGLGEQLHQSLLRQALRSHLEG